MEMVSEITSLDTRTMIVGMSGAIQLLIGTVAEMMMEMVFPISMTLANGTPQLVRASEVSNLLDH